MSDEPSDAQKLILEALSDAIAKSFVGVGEFVIDRQRVARIDGRVDLRAVAAEVDKALGGLQREVLADYNSKPRRWVSSGWTVTE